MPSNAVLRWIDGRGWLILAGDTPASDTVRARALAIAAADGGVAYLATQGVDAAAEQILNDMEAIGAGAGYLVDVLTEDDVVIHDKLADAGLIVIGGDPSVTNVRSALVGAAIEGIQIAYENGAVVLAEGPAAMAFGEWVMLDDGQIGTGMSWLEGALVVPGVPGVADTEAAAVVMRNQPAAIAIGVGDGSALALGPDGEVEPWGDQQVSIALGPDFGA
ncbi:MAG: hypothetical protein CL610_11140 [Anaerolineaceae bacterium]|nr:hypothetical protein [Anaerolineaceae bacterium]